MSDVDQYGEYWYIFNGSGTPSYTQSEPLTGRTNRLHAGTVCKYQCWKVAKPLHRYSHHMVYRYPTWWIISHFKDKLPSRSDYLAGAKMVFLASCLATTSNINTTTTKWQQKNLNNNQRKLLKYAKLNLKKLEPGSGRLLCHPARKRIRRILQFPRRALTTNIYIHKT